MREDYDPQSLRYGAIECATHRWVARTEGNYLPEVDDDLEDDG